MGNIESYRLRFNISMVSKIKQLLSLQYIFKKIWFQRLILYIFDSYVGICYMYLKTKFKKLFEIVY